MQVTPIHTHAVMRVPALTGLFSQSLGVASIAVVKDGTTTITTSAAHDVKVGNAIAVSITDSPFPNPITAAVKLANDDWTLTTTYDHDLTTAPDAAHLPWNSTVRLRGFTDPLMNGLLQLVSVTDRLNFTVRPASEVASITLNSAEEQLVNLEFEMVGWHKVTSTGATTLTFPTPANVVRSYTADDVTLSRNIRIFGSESGALVVKKYVLGDDSLVAGDCVMFIVPRETVRNRSRHLGDHYAGSAYNSRIEDGFDVYVAIPAAASSGGITPVDLAHGEILRAVMKTFNGLEIPSWVGFPCAKTREAELATHGRVSHDGAIYIHQYSFDVFAELTPDDRIYPYEVANFALATSDSVQRVGAPAYRDMTFTGISLKDHPGLLTASIQMDDQT